MAGLCDTVAAVAAVVEHTEIAVELAVEEVLVIVEHVAGAVHLFVLDAVGEAVEVALVVVDAV